MNSSLRAGSVDEQSASLPGRFSRCEMAVLRETACAAAREASRHGLSALAVSQAFDERPIQFDGGVKFLRPFVEKLLRQGLDAAAVCLNVNLPVRNARGVKITRQGIHSHFLHFDAFGGTSREPQEGTGIDKNHAGGC